ncbi:alpha/beta fold hydrolase [Marinobacter caseinilyticus]|uniref:alpha/beta fold hydrolase n=1 Tax=Marinobacter caseinilyticus TaxID=2692195 RepID=UPI00140BAEFB|nr:alpha/beta fold hydrolase [Marinobacter caseinilyticus]
MPAAHQALQLATGPTVSYIAADDGHQIPLLAWLPTEFPKACIHICHGMAEHAARYQDLAVTLTALGYAVFAHNHRGHGPDTKPHELGHYADDGGWQKVTRDVLTVQHTLRGQYPRLNHFLVGHSMGSFIAQGALLAPEQSLVFAGLVLSGSGRDPAIKLAALRLMVGSQRLLKGPHATSRLIHKLTFGAFAQSVKNRHTEFDWISRDPSAVAAYINDPLCGFDCTTQLWRDLGIGLSQLQRPSALSAIPQNLPVLIVSGDEDPVGDFGKGARRLASAYRDSGHSDVSLHVLPGVRHEPFNELNKEHIYQLLTQWLEDIPLPGL